MRTTTTTPKVTTATPKVTMSPIMTTKTLATATAPPTRPAPSKSKIYKKSTSAPYHKMESSTTKTIVAPPTLPQITLTATTSAPTKLEATTVLKPGARYQAQGVKEYREIGTFFRDMAKNLETGAAFKSHKCHT